MVMMMVVMMVIELRHLEAIVLELSTGASATRASSAFNAGTAFGTRIEKVAITCRRGIAFGLGRHRGMSGSYGRQRRGGAEQTGYLLVHGFSCRPSVENPPSAGRFLVYIQR